MSNACFMHNNLANWSSPRPTPLVCECNRTYDEVNWSSGCRVTTSIKIICQGLALLTLSWDKSCDSHSLVNGYPSFYPRIALLAPSPDGNTQTRPMGQCPCRCTSIVQNSSTALAMAEIGPAVVALQHPPQLRYPMGTLARAWGASDHVITQLRTKTVP